MPSAYCAIHRHRIQADFFIEVTLRNIEQLKRIFAMPDVELKLGHRICCEHLLTDHVSTHLRSQKLQAKNKELRKKVKELEEKNQKLTAYIAELQQQLSANGTPLAPFPLSETEENNTKSSSTGQQSAKNLQNSQQDQQDEEDREEIVVDVQEFVKNFLTAKQTTTTQGRSALASVISKAAQACSLKNVKAPEERETTGKKEITSEDEPGSPKKRKGEQEQEEANKPQESQQQNQTSPATEPTQQELLAPPPSLPQLQPVAAPSEDDSKVMPPPIFPPRKKIKLLNRTTATPSS